jgi:hypothetical protein
MTIRACFIGLLLTAIFAILVPWNDWQLKNTLLYNNYLPPVVSLVLLALGLAVNPLLGRFRLAQGELVVVAVMLLGLGGVASSGLMRYLPTYIGNSADVVASQSKLATMQEPLPDDGDPTTPDWRWPVDTDLYVGIPERGPVDRNDPEHQYVVSGYLQGHGGAQNLARVDHRRQVQWRVEPGGEIHGPMPALGGRVAAESRRSGTAFLDLEDERGAQLKGLRLGESAFLPTERKHPVAPGETLSGIAEHYYGDPEVATALARYNQLAAEASLEAGHELQVPDRATVTAIDAEAVPWYAWTSALLSWAPLLLGAFIAMIAVAGVTRRQWMENERLPYPIAAATLAFMEEPEPGRRLAAVFRNSGFWIGLSIAGGIILWRGLHIYGIMPIDFTTTLSLSSTFSGQPWDQVLNGWSLYNPKIFFSIIALVFFLSLELSFSLWAFFLLMQFGTMGLRLSGIPIEGSHVSAASAGGFFTMCLLILWVGRQYYWRLVRAALTFRRDEETREGVPYVWALLLGTGMMLAFLVSKGAPLDAALLAVLLMLGLLLVLARIVAEAGIPFVQTPMGAGFSTIMLSTIGFGLPPGALIPLGIIGSTLMADPREALLPFAVNAGFLGKKSGVSTNRTYSLMLVAVVVGTVIAFGAMIAFSYHGTGATIDGYAPNATARSGWSEPAAMVEKMSTPQGMETAQEERSETLAGYGVGAGIVALLGLARMMFTSWPLHPIGFLTMISYPTAQIWFSLLLGWMWKAGVMRYGGPAIYTRLKPVAIGLIAGEALGAGGFMLVKIIGTAFFDVDLPKFNVLPG